MLEWCSYEMQIYWVTLDLFSCEMFFPFVWPACQLFTQFHDPSAVKEAINYLRRQFKILQDTDSQIMPFKLQKYLLHTFTKYEKFDLFGSWLFPNLIDPSEGRDILFHRFWDHNIYAFLEYSHFWSGTYIYSQKII